MRNEIEICTKILPHPTELLNLFEQTSWAANRNKADVEFLLQNTKIFVVIRMHGKVIGFGRAISDGVYRGLLDDIVVHRDYRKSGIGTLIVEKLMH